LGWKKLRLDRGNSKEKLFVFTNLEFSVSGRYSEKTPSRERIVDWFLVHKPLATS
jgi:hypothetical protein